MKLTLCALLVTVVVSPLFDAAEAKPKRQQRVKEIYGTAESGEPQRDTANVPRERKQVGGTPGDSKSSDDRKPKIGPPVERKLKKAKSKKFDLRTLPQTPPKQKERPEREAPEFEAIELPNPEGASVLSPLAVPAQPAVTAAAPTPIIVFEGLDRQNWGAGSPPDTTGDVGPAYYIQAVNTSVGVYDKTDGSLEAAFTFDTLMSQGDFGNQCDNENFGDPVVLYDTFEDRWILTDFAFTVDGGGNINPPVAYQCFAVSQNNDPITGGWHFYSIEQTDGLHDYEKLAVWTDGIYMSANMFGYPAGSSFQLARVWAFNKAQMYAGSSNVQIVTFDVGNADFTVVPSNARLQTGTPPAGRPNFFISTQNFLNAVGVYQFSVNWNNIPLSTFTGPSTPLAGSSRPSGGAAAVPQSGTAQTLDAVSIRAMVQHQYTNIGGVESLWIPHTVRRVAGGSAAPRWYQVNVTGGTVASPMLQSATWDPDGNNVMNRWMPSLAIDRAGNMALAYSTSSTGTFPSIKYAGRLATDPVNTFSQTEQILFTGTASQTSSNRWGDYSSVMLDPDGCTFWITNQYANPLSQDFDKRWKTKIGAFKYPGCTVVGGGGTVTGTVTATGGGAPISGATVTLGTRTATANGSGVYTFSNIPAGTYPSISASHPGYTTASASNIAVTDGGTSTQNFSLDTAATTACPTDTTQAHFLAGARTNVDVATSPGDVKLATQVTLDQQSPIFAGSGTGSTAITTWFGQTFTPAISGTVARFDLTIFAQNCTPGTMPNIVVAVRNASGNVPSGGDLATATIPGFCNGNALWYTATFATPAAVNAGTQYSIVWRLAAPLPGGSPAPIYFYAQSPNTGTAAQQNPYPGGRRAVSGDSGINWTGQPANANNDHVFRVYIDTGYFASGSFISSTKDANPPSPSTPVWSILAWNGSAPTNTSLRMQVAVSNSELGPFAFVGPDGTSNTYFTTSPVTLSDQFYGFRYLQYKAYLDTTASSVTPVLNDVTFCYQDLDCTGSGPSITPTPAQACANSTGNTATASAGWFSYSWSITNGTITAGQNSQTVTYTAGSSGNVGLTVETRTQLHGCKKTANINIPILAVPAAPTITPGGPTTFCAGGSVTLTSSSANGNQWLLNGNPISGETGQQYVATASGNYSVRVTENGCSATSTPVVVTVNPLPTTPTPTNGGPYCEGQTIQLFTATVSGATYSWTGPNGFTSSDQNPTRSNATLADAGTYSVTVTGNGCTSAAGTTNVAVNPIPATPTASNGGPYCEGQTIQLSTPTVSGAAYSWTGPNGFTSSDQNPARSSATVADAGTYSVTVTVNGCTSAAGSTNVLVNATPATPTANNVGPYCEGQTIQLSTPAVSGATYSWTGPNGFASSDQNPARSNATTADAGTYSVTVTVNGCTSAAGSTNVAVNPIPATPTASNGGPYCAGATIQLFTPAVSGATYSWTGPNGFSSSDQNPARSSATVADAGTYSVTVTVNGCTSAAGSTNVVVNAIPATPTASNGGPYCAGATIQLSTPTVSGATYSWTGPNGFASSDQNPTRNATTANAGTYSVTVTVDGCTSAAGSTNVAVDPIPTAPTITPGGPTTFCAGGSVLLTSSSASGNQWYLNGNIVDGATSQTFSAGASGDYTVTVTSNGCTSAPSTVVTVTVNPVPSTPTITPGGATTFCTGGSVTLGSSSASGNQWYRNNVLLPGENAQTLIATVAGAYQVKVTANGCASAASAAVNVTVNPKPNAAITVASPMFAGASSTASVNVACPGMTFSWGITGGTITSGNGTPVVTFTAGGAGTLTLTVTVTNSFGCSDTKSANVTVNQAPFGPPPFLRATATGTTSASLLWAGVTDAHHYEIYRSTDNVNYVLQGTSSTTTFSQSGLTPSTTYLYKIKAIKADDTASAMSTADPAITMTFTNDPLTACPAVTVQAVHITQLRTRINIFRAGVGLSAYAFTDPSLAPGAQVKGVHLTDLRTALNGALSAIGVTPSYTDPTITSGVTIVKGRHMQELRDLVK